MNSNIELLTQAKFTDIGHRKTRSNTGNTGNTGKRIYDQDLISLIMLLLDTIRTKHYSQPELFFLQRNLDDDAEITLKMLNVESLVSRLSQEVNVETERVFELHRQLDSLSAQLRNLTAVVDQIGKLVP